MMLSEHLTSCEQQHGLVAAAVGFMAVRLGYNAADTYLTLHLPELAWRWIAAGHSAESFLEVLPILADQDGVPSSGVKKLVSAAVPQLLAPVLLYQCEEDYQFLSGVDGNQRLLKGGPGLGAIFANAYLLLEAESDGDLGPPGAREARAVLEARAPGAKSLNFMYLAGKMNAL
eukprot:scaffold647934_cov30-Prasinocladus_malaysianus.AAC.1